ncbi:GABA permease, partial [Acinetobacter baumannii]
TFKMWLHPWLPLFVTLCIVAVLVSMGINPATRLSLLQSLIAIFVIVIAYGAMKIVSPNKASHVPQVNPLRHTK